MDTPNVYFVTDNDLWDGLIQEPRRVAFMGDLNGRHVIAPLRNPRGR
jgi:hypothetical protein